MSDKMREEFEASVLSEYPNQNMGKFATGEYQSTTIEHCWWAWKKSREVLVIELPEDFTSVGSPNMRMLVAHHREIVGLLVQSIEAAGVKVKS
ncbi:hypothetical protein [Pseudomonas veronii]